MVVSLCGGFLVCAQHVCVWLVAVVFGSPVCVCVCSSGGLAAEKPGQRLERGPMRSHPNAEEKTPEHPELHTCSAQERPLETSGSAGKRQQHVDAVPTFFTSWYEKCLTQSVVHWSEFKGCNWYLNNNAWSTFSPSSTQTLYLDTSCTYSEEFVVR